MGENPDAADRSKEKGIIDPLAQEIADLVFEFRLQGCDTSSEEVSQLVPLLDEAINRQLPHLPPRAMISQLEKK